MPGIKEVLKQFDKKFNNPKTLWAQDKSGQWYGKKDVKDFIIHAIKQAFENTRPEELLNTKDETNSDWFYGFGFNNCVKQLKENQDNYLKQ